MHCTEGRCKALEESKPCSAESKASPTFDPQHSHANATRASSWEERNLIADKPEQWRHRERSLAKPGCIQSRGTAEISEPLTKISPCPRQPAQESSPETEKLQLPLSLEDLLRRRVLGSFQLGMLQRPGSHGLDTAGSSTPPDMPLAPGKDSLPTGVSHCGATRVG